MGVKKVIEEERQSYKSQIATGCRNPVINK